MQSADLRRRAASSNPSVAFPALVKLGKAQPIVPTTDSGYKSYGRGGRLFQMGEAVGAWGGGATNVCTDPNGTATTFWPAALTDCVVTANVSLPVSGGPPVLQLESGQVTTALKIAFVNTGTARVYESSKMTFGANLTVQIGPYAFIQPAAAGQVVLEAVIYSFADVEVRTVTLATLTASDAAWARRAAYVLFAAAGEAKVSFRYTFSGGDVTAYFTGHHSVSEMVLSTLVCGGLPDNQWETTANASRSSRVKSILCYDPAGISGSTGTIIVRFTLLGAANDGVARFLAFAQRTGPATSIYLSKGSTGAVGFRFNNGANADCSSAVQTWAALTQHVVIARYVAGASGTLDLNVDGVDAVQTNHTQTAPTLVTHYITSNGGNGNAYVGPTVWVPSRLSDADVATVQTNSQALLSNPLAIVDFLRRGGYANPLIFPLRGDSVGYRMVN